MRILPFFFACFLFALGGLQAQTTNKTYELDLKWLPTEYGNKLGIHTPAVLKNQFPDWKQVNENGTYKVEISFLSEVDPKQYTRKRESGPIYFFQVKYNAPTYLAEIKNQSGETVFKETYGGEKLLVEYGKTEKQNDPDELAIQWRKNRDQFYKTEESKLNNIDAFLPQLITLFGGGETMLAAEEIIEEVEEEAVGANIPSTIEDTIIEEEEVEEIASIETPKPTPPAPEEKVVTSISTPEPVEKTAPEIVETQAEKALRIKKAKEINRQWEAEEEAAIKRKKGKDGRPRYFRLGLRLLVPNIAGVHGEIVTPLLDNRLSIVGDFSSLSFGKSADRFLDEGESFGDEIDGRYQYYSLGANYYFNKQYARGWYVGSSYLKGQAKTSNKENSDFKTVKVNFEAVSARVGVNTGRKAFMFGFEIGAGIPIKNVTGEIYIVDNDVVEVEQVDEKVAVLPVLNVTFGVAF